MTLNSSIILTGNGKFSGDGSLLSNLPLSAYITSSALSSILVPYATTTNVNTSISSALIQYSTTTAMNTAIATALTPYSTTTAMNTAITNALIPYSTTSADEAKYLKLDGTNNMTGDLYIIKPSFASSRSIYLSPKKTDISNFFASKVPFAVYFAEDFSGSTLPNYIANGRDATTTGTITKTTASGNGATGAITYLTGTASSTISFATGSIPSTFTILSLTRYNGGTRQRILTSKTVGNWFHGHWNSRKAAVQYEVQRSQYVIANYLDDWICVVGKNVGSSAGSILYDGVANSINSNGTGNYTLGINNGIYPAEYGDWAFSCVMIWDTALTDAEMLLLNGMINTYKSSGVSMKQYFYDECVMENREYATTKEKELLIFKSNNNNYSAGKDRIRLKASSISFDTYSTQSTDRTTEDTKMIIDKYGGVGIGTTAPFMALDVRGSVAAYTLTLFDSQSITTANKYKLFMNPCAAGVSALIQTAQENVGFNQNLNIQQYGGTITLSGATTIANTCSIQGDLTVSGNISCGTRFLTVSNTFSFNGGSTYCAGFYLNSYPNIINGKTFLIDGSITQSGFRTSTSYGFTQIINNPGPTSSGNIVVKNLYFSSNTVVDWYNAFTSWNDGLNVYTYGTNLPTLVCTLRIIVLG